MEQDWNEFLTILNYIANIRISPIIAFMYIQLPV